jgi:hypothetical protein
MHVGPKNVLPNVQAALTRARQLQANFEGVAPELSLKLAKQPI